MPKLGFDMQEGTLVRWVKAEGDQVNKGEVLAEIETDKATVEVESSFGGVMVRQLVSQGDIVPVGTPIALIAAPGEKVEESAKAAPTGEAATEAGESKPATPASAAPVAAEETPAAAEEKPAAEPAAGQEGNGRLKASPLARKVASDKGVDLRQVKGSGTGGRIVRSDVEAAIQAGPVSAPPAAPAPAAPAAPQPAPAGKPAPALVPLAPVAMGAFQVPDDETIKINRLRSAIGRRMVESKQQVPHFYVTRAYKMEKVMELRKQLNAYLPDDQKLTVNDFILKAVALTLRQFPALNASIKGDEVVRYGHINIGVAVAVEGGLLTIVVKDADQKPLRQISHEVREMAARVRSGKVKTEDIEGSTFSISNLGMFDVDSFVAIINPPEAAILAIGSAKQVPVVEDGLVKPGLRMNATISADHRVTDGAEAARYMQSLAAYLEEPMRLVL
jgi:pyruvate dehydrogenase E2 component (dihydrolipoamide acetyltransferase)